MTITAEQRYVTIGEACRRLDIDETTLRLAERERRIPRIHREPGSDVRIFTGEDIARLAHYFRRAKGY